MWLNHVAPNATSRENPNLSRGLWELLADHKGSLGIIKTQLNELATSNRAGDPHNNRRAYLARDIMSMFDDTFQSADGAHGDTVTTLRDCWRRDSLPITVYNMVSCRTATFTLLA